MEKCDLKTGVCETAAYPGGACQDRCSCEEKCSCGGVCGGDPVMCAMVCWKSAFDVALKQVMVESLKAKMQKSFGPKIDKAADAVMGAMDVKWQAKIMMARAKMELMEKMKEEMLKR